MNCKNCGCENDDKNIQCEVCGAELDNCQIKIDDEKESIDKNKLIIISIIAVIIVIIVAIVVVASLTKSDNNDNTYDNDSSLAVTDNSDFENIAESENEFAQNTIKFEATQSTTEATTLSEAELNRKKALEYIDKANSVLRNGEREGALQMADAALEICQDEDIKKKYDEIYEYAPFELYKKNNIFKEDPKPYIGYEIEIIGSDIANNGSSLPNCFTIMHNEDANGCLSEITYNLSGKYNIVTGTGYLPSYSKNADQNGYFVIYGDGKIIYTSPVFNSGVLPEKFEINVSGVERLVLAFYSKPYNGGGLSGNNYFTHFGISDFTALKNLP